jgi:diguanylate cyclase (GGDEF)-like protein
MTTQLHDRLASPVAVRPDQHRRASLLPLIGRRLARALWPPDRGVAELRWAAITLATMAVLGVLGALLDPVDGEFDRVIFLSAPLAVLIGIMAWGRTAPTVGAIPAVRLLLGPAVVAVALVGAGVADSQTLQRSDAAPVMALAMAYAALTRGYAIAAATISVASLTLLIGHAQDVGLAGLAGGGTDEFVVGFIVTLFASAGMAFVVRLATDAEARATRLSTDSRARVDILERLNRIVARFDGSQPVRDVIQAVVDDVAHEFDITLVSMYLPFGTDQLTMVGVSGYTAPFHQIDIGVGIIGRAAATHRTQFVPDVVADPDYRAARDDVRSEVAAPIVHSGVLLGVVNLEGTTEQPIGPAQVALAEMFVRAVSPVLRSGRLDDERRERLRAVERVLEVSRALVADLDRPRIVASIVDTVAELLDAQVVALFSLRPDGRFRLEAGVGFPAAVTGLEVHGHGGIVGRAIVERIRIDGISKVALWPAAYLDVRPGGTEPHAAMALPIEVGDMVVAVLFVTRIGAENAYTDLEHAIADLLTAQVSIALQNADLHAQVAESAVRDPLTGLLNRRFFDEAVETAYANARRIGSELSLIVLDLDRFSAVNNEYGHSVGDVVLRRVARSIKSAIRDGDMLVRYGGEEFVVIAPATDGEGAVMVAERIRKAVTAAGSEPVDGRYIPITVSAGVASLVDEIDGRGLFRAADSALLAAKRAGRDRVTRI